MGFAEVLIALIGLIAFVRFLKSYEKFWVNKNLVDGMKKEIISKLVPDIKEIHVNYSSFVEANKKDLMSDDPSVRLLAFERIISFSNKNSSDLDIRLNIEN